MRRRRARAHQIEDLPLLGARGIRDVELEHEAVELRLGQRVGAFLIERILRGQHQERIGQRIGRVADGHLPFLHGFEQGALHLGRGAVDFVGEDQVGKERPALGGELAGLRAVNQRADQVSRQQIGRELDALESGLDARAQRLDGERLGEAGHAFEQDVAVGEQADEQPVHEILLADDDATQFGSAKGQSSGCAPGRLGSVPEWWT